MHIYKHVEDYIEIISGYKDLAGNSKFSLFEIPISPLSLARYDVKVVDSFGEQCYNRIGFTDRQAKLAIDIILKYERQLAKLKVDIGPIKQQPEFRFPLREIDRSTRSWVDNDKIYVRFPYNVDLITAIKNSASESCGRISWNRDLRVWEAELTEHNVNWAHTFSLANNFSVDPTLQQLMDAILTTEKTNYKIELRAQGEQLEITNAESTLNEYVENTLGGFQLDNLLTLVDSSSRLGYQIDKLIEEVVIENYGPRFFSLCTNKELKVDLRSNPQDQIAQIVQYAEATNRYPIYVYEPDTSDRLTMLFIRHFAKGQVVNLNKKEAVTPETKLVYTSKIPRDPVSRIPLLVSSSGMMYGGDRQIWLQEAEKIVYFTNDVYNKAKQGKDLCRLD